MRFNKVMHVELVRKFGERPNSHWDYSRPVDGSDPMDGCVVNVGNDQGWGITHTVGPDRSKQLHWHERNLAGHPRIKDAVCVWYDASVKGYRILYSFCDGDIPGSLLQPPVAVADEPAL